MLRSGIRNRLWIPLQAGPRSAPGPPVLLPFLSSLRDGAFGYLSVSSGNKNPHLREIGSKRNEAGPGFFLAGIMTAESFVIRRTAPPTLSLLRTVGSNMSHFVSFSRFVKKKIRNMVTVRRGPIPDHGNRLACEWRVKSWWSK